jgi:hypothetical protein
MPQAAEEDKKPRAAFTPPEVRLMFLGILEWEVLTGMKDMKKDGNDSDR